ncbi:uncharacterized protein At2g29880-like [Cornus florida]|uniref:uncharacterized protein At2g29880-like n=1 Tax=Cornus florida TaxID=4283 RepID=UPI0028A16F42|nr:uncharacterized protein At2g29880-like [Cornus florida]
MVVADDAIWNDYIKSIKNYEELCIIFGNDQGLVTSDIGAEADIALVSDNEGMETAIVSVTQNDDKQAKNLRWTEEMDRCLGKVLVKEVQKGHKVDNVIQTEAYNTAVAALNKMFRPDITKDHIKNRLKTWKKQYVILKELLSHTGFRWDETQNKMIGDDSDWNDYIKTHHEAHLFRGRVVENYDHLCIIFGNHYANASNSRTADDVVHTLACDSEGVEAIKGPFGMRFNLGVLFFAKTEIAFLLLECFGKNRKHVWERCFAVEMSETKICKTRLVSHAFQEF